MENNFENSIKNKVEQFDEVPSEKTWTDLSKKLNQEKNIEMPKNNNWKTWTALVIISAVSLAIFWKFNSAESPLPANESNQPIAEENILTDQPAAELVIAENSGNTAKEMFPLELKKAEKNEKALMVYVCMEGCKPCARFVKETLSQPDVENYLEANFDQVAVDMKAKDNKPFLKNYETNASPSVLFFDTDGEFLGKTMGACAKEVFMKEAKNARKKSLQE